MPRFILFYDRRNVRLDCSEGRLGFLSFRVQRSTCLNFVASGCVSICCFLYHSLLRCCNRPLDLHCCPRFQFATAAYQSWRESEIRVSGIAFMNPFGCRH
ncbi:unnamed protein product [Prorocentrum cordatum]|uniref:Uncharacterized protein n=1 Tax=Prorocentrum cordatum TaxID=2364126 RepID=A0ABN9TZ81_9DINO|nr:unnamed protein product [Polarella glacialis]